MALDEFNHLRSASTHLQFEAEVEINGAVAVVFTFLPALGLKDRIGGVRLHRLWWVLVALVTGPTVPRAVLAPARPRPRCGHPTARSASSP